MWILVGLSIVIGIGSGLFHTFAATWARVLDVVPILLFQLVFLWLYCSRILEMRSILVRGLLLTFLVSALYGRQFPEILNGSLTYLPAALVLSVLGVNHYKRKLVDAAVLLIAAGVFIASLLFRSIDLMVCDVLPIGTHFLWHILNAVLLYLVSRAYLGNLPAAQREA